MVILNLFVPMGRFLLELLDFSLSCYESIDERRYKDSINSQKYSN